MRMITPEEVRDHLDGRPLPEVAEVARGFLEAMAEDPGQPVLMRRCAGEIASAIDERTEQGGDVTDDETREEDGRRIARAADWSWEHGIAESDSLRRAVLVEHRRTLHSLAREVRRLRRRIDGE